MKLEKMLQESDQQIEFMKQQSLFEIAKLEQRFQEEVRGREEDRKESEFQSKTMQ